MTARQRPLLESFLSLEWYDITLRFVFTFVAKTSEVLLAAGLVVSTANFLTDGSVMATHPDVSTAWAWAQAIAIDSSLGVCLYYTFQYLKEHEWLKGILYGLLTLLLAVVAGAITTIDIVSHALHVSLNRAMEQMVMNVTLLSQFRAIAVVGFLLMSRLRDVPFNGLLTQKEPGPLIPLPKSGVTRQAQIQQVVEQLFSMFPLEEVVQILNTCAKSPQIAITTIAPKRVPPSLDTAKMEPSQAQHSVPEHEGTGPASVELAPVTELAVPVPLGPAERQSRSPVEPMVQQRVPPSQVQRQASLVLSQPQEPAESAEDRERKLERAYQELLAEGKKPSGRALAERVHVHRATCVAWLRTRHQRDIQREQSSVPEGMNEESSPCEPAAIPATEPP